MIYFNIDFDDWPNDDMEEAFLEDGGSFTFPNSIEKTKKRIYKNVVKDKVWVTKDGRVLTLEEMEDDHLANTYNYVKREYGLGEGHPVGDAFIREMDARKEEGTFKPSKFNQLENFMEQEENSMNNGFNMKNVAALVRDDITTVNVTHEHTSKVYTYKVTKELAKKLQVNDIVLVKNAHGITTGTIMKVHSEPEIEIQGVAISAWVFQKVDTAEVEQLEKDDRLIEKRINKLQARSARDQALAALGIQADQTQGLLEQVRKEEDDDFDNDIMNDKDEDVV